MEEQEPWVLLIQGHQFLWCFRVKISGCVVGKSVELLVSVDSGKQDLPLRLEPHGSPGENLKFIESNEKENITCIYNLSLYIYIYSEDRSKRKLYSYDCLH
jgi:hypothetical protein